MFCLEWSEWEEWGDCNTPCGSGQRFRVRTCSTGYPWDCEGSQTDYRQCILPACSTVPSGMLFCSVKTIPIPYIGWLKTTLDSYSDI